MVHYNGTGGASSGYSRVPNGTTVRTMAQQHQSNGGPAAVGIQPPNHPAPPPPAHSTGAFSNYDNNSSEVTTFPSGRKSMSKQQSSDLDCLTVRRSALEDSSKQQTGFKS